MPNVLQEAWRTIHDDYLQKLEESLPKRLVSANRCTYFTFSQKNIKKLRVTQTFFTVL